MNKKIKVGDVVFWVHNGTPHVGFVHVGLLYAFSTQNVVPEPLILMTKKQVSDKIKEAL